MLRKIKAKVLCKFLLAVVTGKLHRVLQNLAKEHVMIYMHGINKKYISKKRYSYAFS